MANFRTGVVITGDAKGAVRAVELTQKELKQLNAAQRRSSRSARDFARQSGLARRALQSFAGGVVRATKVAAGFGTVVGALAVGGLARLVKSGLQAGDSLAKTSDRLGISTEKLAGLRLAAEQTGVQIREFDIALQRMVRRTAEAAKGTGEAQAAIKALGLDAKELGKLTPDEVFSRVADAMKNVDSQSERVALAFKLFDSEGVKLLNTLQLGSDGLASFEEKARIAGLTLSDETAAQIERANDAMGLLRNLTAGLGQQLAAKFAPILENLAGRFFDVAVEAGGMGKVADRVFDFLIDAAVAVTNAIDGIRAVWAIVKAAFLSGAKVIAGAIEKLVRASLAMTRLPGIGFFISDERQQQLENFAEAFASTQEQLAKDAEKAWLEAERKVSDYGETAERVRLEIEEITRSTQTAAGAQGTLAKMLENQVYPEIESIGDAFEDTTAKAVRGAQVTASAWSRAGSQISQAVEGAFSGLLSSRLGLGGAGGFGGAISGTLGGILSGAVIEQATAGAQSSGIGNNIGLLGALAGIGGNINNVLLQGRSAILGGLNNLGLGGAANAFGQGTASIARLGGRFGIGGGLALTALGGFAGGELGELLGGQSGPLSALGGLGGTFVGSNLAALGAFGGPIGAAVGALIGSLAQGLFSGDGKKRFNVGVLQGDLGRFDPSRLTNVTTAASGLELAAFNRRGGSEGQQTAEQLLQTLLGLDAALTALTGADLTGRTLTGRVADAGRTGPGQFFGLSGFNGLDEGSLEEAADNFVVAWLAEVNDQLPARVRQLTAGVDRTAEALVTALEAAFSIDRLLDLDVVSRTEEAFEALGKALERPLLNAYDQLTEAVLEAAAGLDGSAASLVTLNNALSQQKAIAADLAAAYKSVGIEVAAALGTTAQSIRESILDEEALYNLRRQQIADITRQIGETVDPNVLRSLSLEANRLIGSVFGTLTPDQQQAQAAGFITTLEQLESLIERQIAQGESQLAERERGVLQAVDLELSTLGNTTQTVTGQFEALSGELNDFVNRLNLSSRQLAQIQESLAALQTSGGVTRL